MKQPEKKQRIADALCLVIAIIWGSAFTANQYAIDANFSSSLIMAMRFSAASLVMLVLCAKKLKSITKADLLHGGISGVILFAAFFLQTTGQSMATVSHSAFITATNVVMVPFIVWAVRRKAPPVKIFLLAGTTLAGIGILTLHGGASQGFRLGDAILFVCAFFFALHIFYLGIAVTDRDPMVINLIQIGTAAIISLFALFVFDRGAIPVADYSSGLFPVLYLGLASTCLCYMLQTWAQKYTSETKAGILMSTEGLFGSLFSVLLGLEPLTSSLVIGGAVILLSVILMEVPLGNKRPQV